MNIFGFLALFIGLKAFYRKSNVCKYYDNCYASNMQKNYVFENKMDNRFTIETFIKIMYSNESQVHEYILLRNIKRNLFTVVCCHCYTQKPNFDEYQKSQELVHDILSGFPPEERDEWFSTIQEAIQEHDLAFNNFYNDFVNDK